MPAPLLDAPPREPRPCRIDGITRRLVYAFALIPIIPATSMAAMTLLEPAFPSASFDELRYFQLVFSSLVVLAAILIWRKAVVWTLGRRWLTALVSLIPFVQVAVNLPLWHGTGGCDPTEEILRMGQHQIGIGVWIWLLIWVWWGWEKVNMMKSVDSFAMAARITPLAKRVTMSIGMIPFLVGVFLLGGETAKHFVPLLWYGGYSGNAPELVGLASMLIAAFVTWLLVWRTAVTWSRSVRWRTLSTWLVFVAAPLIALFLLSNRSLSWAETIAVCLTLIGWGLWMAWTMQIWPMKPEALAVDPMGPTCLKCGYSLRGLRATRCPECGDEPTLDELWMAQSLA